jgi:entericidin B
MLGRWGGAVCAMLLLIVLAGCNTMRGLGQDVEAGGQKIEEGATAVQKKL